MQCPVLANADAVLTVSRGLSSWMKSWRFMNGRYFFNHPKCSVKPPSNLIFYPYFYPLAEHSHGNINFLLDRGYVGQVPGTAQWLWDRSNLGPLALLVHVLGCQALFGPTRPPIQTEDRASRFGP